MKILSAIVLSFIFATGVYAEGLSAVTGIATSEPTVVYTEMPAVTGVATSEPTVKYEVTFKVVYYAVSAERAAEISKEIMTKYQDACKVEVRSMKNDGDILTFSNDSSVYLNITN